MTGNPETFDKSCRGIIERARVDQDVLAVMVYGSRARGEGTPNSDIDICLTTPAFNE